MRQQQRCVTYSVINAYSSTTPFVTSLDFNKSLTISDGLDPASLTFFSFGDGPSEPGSVDQYSEFYGSISSLSVNPVPLPSTLVLFASGLGVMGWFAWRSKRKAMPSV
jgi:hypothetical protein